MAGLPIEIALDDERATQRLGQDLALALRPGDCLALRGDLGAGKSTLARALIRCIAADPDLEVPSPTFTLVQSYDLRIPIAHFDLYRIADPDELVELGLDDALDDGAVLIEWPEHAQGALPSGRVLIEIEEAPRDSRQVRISGPEPVLQRIRRSLDIRAFLDAAGHDDTNRQFLQGDASARTYETVTTAGGEQFILMDAPKRLIGPVLCDGKRYAEIAHVAEDIRPFVAIASFLRRSGFRAPEILAQDLDAGFLLLEDLGRDGILDARGLPITERWEAAIDCLVALHRTDVPQHITMQGGADHTIPPFDREAILIEVDLYLSWYLPHKLGVEPSSKLQERFHAGWNGLIDRLAQAPKSLVLRDFHSPNILWQADRSGIERIGLIDFQDAMIGPAAYDVASLVQDARAAVEPALHDHLLVRYERIRSEDPGFDPVLFREALAIMECQRATKILGIFVRLKKRDAKPGYLRHLPRIEAYLRRALAHPVLHPLHDCYTEAGITPSES